LTIVRAKPKLELESDIKTASGYASQLDLAA
jgi:hypothetical protein